MTRKRKRIGVKPRPQRHIFKATLESDAKVMVRKLSKHFLPTKRYGVGITLWPNRRGSFANECAIQIGLKYRLEKGLYNRDRSTIEDIILHEFTHCLDYYRHDWRKRTITKRRQFGPNIGELERAFRGETYTASQYTYHDEPFVELLEEVAEWWYGDARCYDWNNDYKRVCSIRRRRIKEQRRTARQTLAYA